MLERIPLASKNAISPILWLVGILAATVIPATIWLPTWAAVLGWLFLAGSVATAIWSFQHFVRHDPNQLRSEDHSLKLEALHLHTRSPGSGDQIATILSSQPVTGREFLLDGKARSHGE